ncbi:MAG: hypothetical protein K0S61_133 [Anaerocolumna sp.]|jgi:hypothetical protein|nr:hypothetical protein [Anaerocolumna sp.]
MAKRLEFHELLKNLIMPNAVYFQPPENFKIQYPCIIYSRISDDVKYADDSIYNKRIGYQLQVIDNDPDSQILEKVESLQMCKFNRHYTKDNLNYNVYTIFY